MTALKTDLFKITRKQQEAIIVEGCGTTDTVTRERRIKLHGFMDRNITPMNGESPFYYDLSLVLDSLSDEQVAEVFLNYLSLL
jgi:hypothetical protein